MIINRSVEFSQKKRHEGMQEHHSARQFLKQDRALPVCHFLCVKVVEENYVCRNNSK
jgi:hypothetical protein